MTDPTPNGQTGERICPLATCFGCPDPGRCDALRRGDQPAPSQRDPELAAALNEQRRQSYNAETQRTRPPSTPVPEASRRPKWEPLTLREAAIEAILIREQDTAFSTVARIIAALPTPSPEASDERPGWADLMAILDEVYPADVFSLGHPDPGPQIVGYLRAIDKLRGRDPRPAPSSSPVGDRVLDELRKLSDAASDGPWEWVGDELVGPHDPHDLEDFPDEDRREYLLAVQHVAGLANPQPADAAFIAAAVNYVRALLAAAPSPAPLAADRWVCFDSGDLCSHHDPHPGCRYVDRFPPAPLADRFDLESIRDDIESGKELDAVATIERLLAAADRGEPTS